MLHKILKKLSLIFDNYKPQFCAPPSLLQVELTSRCNLNCAMCARSHGLARKTGDMDLDLFKEVVTQSTHYKMPIGWFHHFGETLLYPHLEEALVYFNEHGIGYGGVSTNAILLNKEKREILINNAKHVLCDVDSMYPEAYRKIRNNDNHEKILSNVKYFIEERKRSNSNCEITIQFLRTQFNNDEEITGMMDFFGYHPYVKYMEKGTVKHPRGGDITVYRGANILDNRHDCCMCKSQLCILNSGEAVACCWDANGEQIIGDIKKETLAEIWRGKRHTAMQAALANNDFSLLPLCARCAGPGIGDRERVLEQVNIYQEHWKYENGRIIFAPAGEYMQTLLSSSNLHRLGSRLFLLEENSSMEKDAPIPTIRKENIMPNDTIFLHSPFDCSKLYFDLQSLKSQGTKIIVIGSFIS